MSSTPEGKVKVQLSKTLKALGVLNTNDALVHLMKQDEAYITGWYYMPSTNGYGEAGVWDYVGVYRGQMFMIETKAGSNKLSAHQKIKGNVATAAGGSCYVVRTIEQAKNFSFTDEVYTPEKLGG